MDPVFSSEPHKMFRDGFFPARACVNPAYLGSRVVRLRAALSHRLAVSRTEGSFGALLHPKNKEKKAGISQAASNIP